MKLDPIVLPREELGSIITGNGIETASKVELEYFNAENKRSLYNIAPDCVRPALNNTHVKNFLMLPETELRAKLKPNTTLCRLRISFWREFDRAQARLDTMKVQRVVSGICSLEEFRHIVVNTNHIAWLLKPPTDYVNAMEEALVFGIERLREILEIPLIKSEYQRSGEKEWELLESMDIDAANVILKTVALLDMRVKGALVQKVEQKVVSENRNITANLNATISNIQLQSQLAPEELDKKLLRLQKDIAKSTNVTKPLTIKELKSAQVRGIRVEEMPDIEIMEPPPEGSIFISPLKLEDISMDTSKFELFNDL